MPTTTVSEPFASSNRVLHESAKEYYWKGAGGLSVKSFSNGAAHYQVDGFNIQVDDQSYLVLNRGQEYSITIDSASVVDSFCLFFQDGFSEEVCRSICKDVETLVDDPTGDPGDLEFFQMTRPHDDILTPVLNRFRVAYPLRRHESGWMEEQMHGIAERLLKAHRVVLWEVEKIPTCHIRVRHLPFRV